MLTDHSLLQFSILASALAINYYILNVQDSNQLLVTHHQYVHLTAMSNDHFRDNFGLDKEEFKQIHKALKLPVFIETNVQDVEDSCTALLMLLGYLRGRSLLGLESQYGWSASRVSRIRLELVQILL